MKEPNRNIIVKTESEEQHKHVQGICFSWGVSWIGSGYDYVPFSSSYYYLVIDIEKGKLFTALTKEAALNCMISDEIMSLSYKEFLNIIEYNKPTDFLIGKRKMYYWKGGQSV